MKIKVSKLKVGDRFVHKRYGYVYVITQIGGYHGDEISFDQLKPHKMIGEILIRKRMMTFKEFERFRYLQRSVK